MSRYHSYLNSAVKILETYKGDVPLAAFLKQYFAANKKYGSKDRKQIAALCYNYFRLGFAVKNSSIEERILLGTFLSEDEPSVLMTELREEWGGQMTLSFEKKMELVKDSFSLANVFPFQEELSTGISFEKYCASFFIRPDLFLRIRPKASKKVLQKLDELKIDARLIGNDCIALPNSTKATDLFEIDKDVVVQDLNSQKVLDFFKQQKINPDPKVWDCCAASGGKSILLYDILEGKLQLTVSDKRDSIIANLHKRFTTAGIKLYHPFVSDLSKAGIPLAAKPHINNSQVIICDVPCSGSGTWGRTPEQLYFFKKEKIEFFNNKQKEIVSNVIAFLEKGGWLVYITCSVFKEENEGVVNFLKEKFELELVQMELLKGYDKKADSLFVTILKK
jgi:16S rRNA (cytosine967-C5)-methyltransferase